MGYTRIVRWAVENHSPLSEDRVKAYDIANSTDNDSGHLQPQIQDLNFLVEIYFILGVKLILKHVFIIISSSLP